jgi:phosphatidylethanolamine-binding protein (PEBP) family uncharacterized protein
MASGRFAVGGLITTAIVLALIVTGCGGGDSSASGTTGTGTAPVLKPETTAKPEANAKSEATKADKTANAEEAAKPTSESGAVEAETGGAATTGKKKHPPLSLPTGKPEEAPTEAQRAKVPTADLEVAVAGGKLTAANTCEGEDLSPAVEWGQIPPGTTELALFVMNLEPVEGGLYFDWAVAGIDPTLEGLEVGKPPKGAVVGRNSAGQNEYSLCPHGKANEQYIFALYALTDGVSPKQGFEPLELRKEATEASESVGIYAAHF